MKFTWMMMTAAMAAMLGCSEFAPKTSTAGGPGATKGNAAAGATEDMFTLRVPATTSVQQGKQTEVTIAIVRTKNFAEDVSLQLADIPKGVTFEPAEPVIRHGDSETKVVFLAGEDATVGPFKLKVTGHPTVGKDAKIDFALVVAAKDGFSLTVPRLSTAVKQGETRSFVVGVKRDSGFAEDVTLTFSDMPAGVTLEPNTSIVKQGESEASIELSATDDAALGDFAVKVTGHPRKGADASKKVELTIVPK